MPRDVLFDNDIPADVAGCVKSGVHLVSCFDVDRNTLALVAIARLDRHGQADFIGYAPGILFCGDNAPDRHWNPSCIKQHFGQIFVLRDRLGDRTGHVCLSCLDATLLGSPAKLNHAAFGEPAIGHPVMECGLHDGSRAGTQPDVLVDFPESCQSLADIKGFIVPGGLAE